ncbi:MAG TPA: extracellular solute-binding protein [Gemmatimonadales bacterium]|nr:extracellular solute-binding protein [Gemmatimonadales bacterium]
MGRLALVVLLLFAGACSGDGRAVLTVYSPHGKDMLEHYERGFEAENPDVDVQWVDMGSQEVLDRLRAESVNPQADVWFGAPADIFQKAAAEGLLASYSPTWAASVPAEARDVQDRWYGTYLTPEVIGYNTDAVSESEAPTDWDDVLASRWQNQVVIRDPIASGSMRAIFGAILERSIRQTGNTDSGWAWLRRLDANTREYTFNPTILYTKLERQEGVITLYNMPDIAMLAQRRNAPIGYVIPASGTPLLVDGIALVAGGGQPEIAQAYYEFVTSREALLKAANDFLRIPARTDIPVDSLPEWIRTARERIRPMPLDAQLMADSLDAWMTYWDSNVRNRGDAR